MEIRTARAGETDSYGCNTTAMECGACCLPEGSKVRRSQPDPAASLRAVSCYPAVYGEIVSIAHTSWSNGAGLSPVHRENRFGRVQDN